MHFQYKYAIKQNSNQFNSLYFVGIEGTSKVECFSLQLV